MCFFRFLFRSCECGTQNDDLESCQRDSRPSSSSSRVHPCHLHSEFEGLSGPYGDIVFCPAHCEESFPPKYEDALKMAVCTSVRTSMTQSTLTNQSASDTPVTPSTPDIPGVLRTQRPSISSPPPFYSENSEFAQRNPEEGELPPSYTNTSGQFPSPNVFQPILRVTGIFRNPENNSKNESSDPKSKTNTRLSLGEIEPHLDRSTTPHIDTSTTPHIDRSTTPYLERSATSHSRRNSLRPPRVPLPGAIEDSDEESESSQPERIQRS